MVAPREGRVSRNVTVLSTNLPISVAPREGRVSRNDDIAGGSVAPREGRVSRNDTICFFVKFKISRAPRGACE